MALLDIRKQFISFSGRYDLITDQIAYSNNGADFFIQSGQRWLDRFVNIYKEEARHFFPLDSGDWYVTVPSRTVREVWVIGDNFKKKLKKRPYPEIHKYCGGDPGRIQPSCPRYYAIAPIRTIPEVRDITAIDHYHNSVYDNRYFAGYVTLRNELSDVYTLIIDAAHQTFIMPGMAPTSYTGVALKDIFVGSVFNSIQMIASNDLLTNLWLYPDILGQLLVGTVQPEGQVINVGTQLNINSIASTADYVTCSTILEHTVNVGAVIPPPTPHFANIGVVFYPPAMDGFELEVLGATEQPDLVLDTDINYWTEEQPIVLVMAACRSLEQSYRNKEGVADWEAAIKTEVLGLELDLAEMESNELSQMEG